MKKTIIALLHNNFEDLELWYPILRMREAGYEVLLCGESAGEVYIGKYGVPARADISFDEVDVESSAGILVPGGWAPDKLRRFDAVLKMIKGFDEAKKPIGQICHAGWVLVSADILRGRKVTSTPGIKDDMINAGATWLDAPVVSDGHIISSRRPADLPEYMAEYIRVLEKDS